jgi:hypothetical protein
MGISNLRGFTQSCERPQPSPPQYAIRRHFGFNLLCNFSEACLRTARAPVPISFRVDRDHSHVGGRQPRADKDKSIFGLAD